MSFFTKIHDWFLSEEAKVVAFLKPTVLAYIHNIESVGIADVEGFLLAAGPVALAAGTAAVGGGLAGVAVRDAVVTALKPVAVQYGASLAHDAITAVLNTTAELQHQPAVAADVAAPAPDAPPAPAAP